MAVKYIGDEGECWTSFNDANVPMIVFLSEPGDWSADDEDDADKWHLSITAFMPRKESCFVALEAVADTREELAALVREHVVPWFERATNQLRDTGELYYWPEKPKPEGGGA